MFFRRRRGEPLGRQGERIAARFLRRQGYAILEKNLHLGRYEVDIVAREGDTIAFVEVKTRRADDLAGPEDNVTAEKRRRLIVAARIYLGARREPGLYYRFDVVAITLPEKGKPQITLYRNAFTDAQ